MKEIKSNLRWAGGKSKMIKILDTFMPDSVDKYLELFTGGGSVLLHIIQKYKPYKVIANDIDANLINYYQSIRSNPEEIINDCLEIKKTYNKEQFKNKFLELNPSNAKDFFIKNKTSFSGLNSNFSKLAYDRNFSINSINKIRDVSKAIQNVEFTNYDFQDIDMDLRDYFIYLDPPYYSNKEKGLYGKKGILHKEFNHEALFDWVEYYGKDNKIMISYDDCEYIRNLYNGYHIYNFDFVYSMTNTGGNSCKNGKEIVITNYDIVSNPYIKEENMNNEKFIIYNKTTKFTDLEVFKMISDVLSKGLISGNNNLYCYASTYFFEKFKVHIEFMKTKYGYKIYAYEETK